jgi:hypothetical protein
MACVSPLMAIVQPDINARPVRSSATRSRAGARLPASPGLSAGAAALREPFSSRWSAKNQEKVWPRFRDADARLPNDPVSTWFAGLPAMVRRRVRSLREIAQPHCFAFPGVLGLLA